MLIQLFDAALNKLSKYLNTGNPGQEVSPEKAQGVPLQIVLAKQFLNMSESDPRIKALVGFNTEKTPWCAGFINAIEKQCGRKGTGKLLARSFLNYGKPTAIPKIGDIVVFKRGNSSWQGHVGYFITDDATSITCLGGNQSDKVCYAKYPRTSVLGFRRPI